MLLIVFLRSQLFPIKKKNQRIIKTYIYIQRTIKLQKSGEVLSEFLVHTIPDCFIQSFSPVLSNFYIYFPCNFQRHCVNNSRNIPQCPLRIEWKQTVKIKTFIQRLCWCFAMLNLIKTTTENQRGSEGRFHCPK